MQQEFRLNGQEVKGGQSLSDIHFSVTGSQDNKCVVSKNIDKDTVSAVLTTLARFSNLDKEDIGKKMSYCEQTARILNRYEVDYGDYIRFLFSESSNCSFGYQFNYDARTRYDIECAFREAAYFLRFLGDCRGGLEAVARIFPNEEIVENMRNSIARLIDSIEEAGCSSVVPMRTSLLYCECIFSENARCRCGHVRDNPFSGCLGFIANIENGWKDADSLAKKMMKDFMSCEQILSRLPKLLKTNGEEILIPKEFNEYLHNSDREKLLSIKKG